MSTNVTFVALGTLDPNGQEDFEAYASGAPALLMAAGGQVRCRMKVVESLVGDNAPQSVFMIDFDSAETVKKVFDSPEYKALIPHRDKAFSKVDFFLAEDT
ncbi:MAG: DUF1330 domain-containing protein [Pseudomonadota bacterium]